MKNKKMFMLNGNGVAEWIVAGTKYEALEHATSIWGVSTVIECFQEDKENDPEITYNEWLEQFVVEEDLEKDFTMYYEDRDVTKKVKDWLIDVKEVPCHFACSEC